MVAGRCIAMCTGASAREDDCSWLIDAHVGALALEARPCLRYGDMCRQLAALVAKSDGRGDSVEVRDGMSKVVLTVGPGHTLRAAARLMAGKGVGAAVVLDPDQAGVGILTERDL